MYSIGNFGQTNPGGVAQGATVRTDGALIVTGYFYDAGSYAFRVLALDPASNNVLWDKRYQFSNRDFANSVAAGPNNTVLVAGNTNSGGYQKWIITELDGNGSQLWTDNYPSATDSSAERAGFDASGAVLVAGTVDMGGTEQIMVARYSPIGTQLWATIQSNPIAEYITDMKAESDGQTWTLIQQAGNGNPALLLSLDSAGNQIYDTALYTPPGMAMHTPPGMPILGSGLQALKSGQAWVVGQASNGSGYDAIATLYDASGNRQFISGYTGPGGNLAKSVALGPKGPAVAGYAQGGVVAVIQRYGDDACLFTATPTASPTYTATASFTATPVGTPGCSVTGSYAADGSGEFSDDTIYFMPLISTPGQTVRTVTLQMGVPDGNYMQAALYTDNGSGQPGLLLAQSSAVPVGVAGPFTLTLPSGTFTLPAQTVWLAFYGTGGSGSYTLAASAEQTSDFQYWDSTPFPSSVGSSATDEGNGFGTVAVDLNDCAASPTPTPVQACFGWTRDDASGGSSGTRTQALAVDALGNVVVTGSGAVGMHTVKYSADGSSVLWTADDSSSQGGSGVAVDPSGAVLVCSGAYINGQYAMHTVKYSSDGSTVLWVQNDPGFGAYCAAQGVAADGAGNVVVTGMAYSGGEAIMRTVKYSSGGAEVWSQDDATGGTWDQGRGVATDGQGNVVVEGSANIGGQYFMHTVKYSADGSTLLWTRNEAAGSFGVGVAVDSAGDVVATGTMTVAGQGVAHTVKYSADGSTVLWTRNDNSGGNTGTGATGVAVDGAGDVVTNGYAAVSGQNDMHTVEYSADGTQVLWTQNSSPGGVYGTYSAGVGVDPGGNVAVTGYTGGSYNLIEAYTMKLPNANCWTPTPTITQTGTITPTFTASPTPTQTPTFTGGLTCDIAGYTDSDGSGTFSDDTVYYMPLTVLNSQIAVNVTLVMDAPDGNYMQAALYADNGSGQPGTLLGDSNAVPVAAPGSFSMALAGPGGIALSPGTVWIALLGTGGTGTYTLAASAEQTCDFQYWDNVVFTQTVGGQATDEGGGFGALEVDLDACAVSPTPTPNVACASWTQNDASGQDGVTGYGVAKDGAGNVVVTSQGVFGNQGMMHTVKYSADGSTILWTRNDPGWSQAVAVDGAGNVAVTGYSISNNRYVMHTIKVSADGGTLLWIHDDGGDGTGYAYGYGVAFDPSGDVVVTGQAEINNQWVMYTQKYLGADGSLLWTQSFQGPGSGYLSGTYGEGVAVDASGNVAVTGYDGASSPEAMCTVKYSPNGSQLWSQLDSVAQSGTVGQAVAFDHEGNVVVAGSAYASVQNEIHVDKYSADGSTLLWSVSDGNDGYSEGFGVAVNPSDEVVVTGWATPSNQQIMMTLLFSGDGTSLLWSYGDNSGGNGGTQGLAVATDRAGNVVVTGKSANGPYPLMHTVEYGCP